MTPYSILRGKVSAYPSDQDKGLIEVQIGALDSENDTVLARVEQSMSGVYWLPEIGDVVEVEVPALPGYEARIVHIHRAKQDPQTETCWTDKNDCKELSTRSGHRLTFKDTQDEGTILLHTAGGLELSMDDKAQTVTVGKEGSPMLSMDLKEGTVRLEAEKNITISCGGATVTLDDSGNISIAAKGKLELSGQEVSIQAKTKLSGKGQQVEFSGDVGAKLAGQSQAEISSSGVTTVKGSMVKLN